MLELSPGVLMDAYAQELQKRLEDAGLAIEWRYGHAVVMPSGLRFECQPTGEVAVYTSEDARAPVALVRSVHILLEYARH